jgi:hypothetical protein
MNAAAASKVMIAAAPNAAACPNNCHKAPNSTGQRQQPDRQMVQAKRRALVLGRRVVADQRPFGAFGGRGSAGIEQEQRPQLQAVAVGGPHGRQQSGAQQPAAGHHRRAAEAVGQVTGR